MAAASVARWSDLAGAGRGGAPNILGGQLTAGCLFVAAWSAQRDADNSPDASSGNSLGGLDDPSSAGDKFADPWSASAPGSGSQPGPYFDMEGRSNVTALLGKTAFLYCRVRRLGNKTVRMRMRMALGRNSLWVPRRELESGFETSGGGRRNAAVASSSCRNFENKIRSKVS